ncbi:MAG: NUDIX hydrolase [Moraxellaceae bacterium]
MLLSPETVSFDELTVAAPSFIRYPTLRKLAERVQNETLDMLNPVMQGGHHVSRSARILDSLYKTPIADASILVAITHERHPKLLLTRRAAHMKSHAGEVACAGGKYEIGDGNNVVTALREACEETALLPNKVQLLGQLPTQTSKSGMSVRPIVALIAPDLVLVPEIGEISRIFWADFEALLTQPTVEYSIEYAMQDQVATILTPSWQVDGETVWGLTGRVIASLLETGFDRQLEWYYRVQDTRS